MSAWVIATIRLIMKEEEVFLDDSASSVSDAQVEKRKKKHFHRLYRRREKTASRRDPSFIFTWNVHSNNNQLHISSSSSSLNQEEKKKMCTTTPITISPGVNVQRCWKQQPHDSSIFSSYLFAFFFKKKNTKNGELLFSSLDSIFRWQKEIFFFFTEEWPTSTF